MTDPGTKTLDSEGRLTRLDFLSGAWQTWEYDKQGRCTLWSTSKPYWKRVSYSDQQDGLYLIIEDSDGFWLNHNRKNGKTSSIEFKTGNGSHTDFFWPN